jgi:hypothetical protein
MEIGTGVPRAAPCGNTVPEYPTAVLQGAMCGFLHLQTFDTT